NGATHPALISDYYPVYVRPAVFGFYNAASPVGRLVAAFAAGWLAYLFTWRVPFIVFAIPTLVLVVLALRLKDPIRGKHEREAHGADAEVAATEEAPASMAEAWRTLWQVRTLRRIWISLPFIAIPLFALSPLLQLFYADVLGLNEVQRGYLSMASEPAQILGLILGIPLASKLMRRDPALLIRLLAGASVLQVFALVFL